MNNRRIKTLMVENKRGTNIESLQIHKNRTVSSDAGKRKSGLYMQSGERKNSCDHACRRGDRMPERYEGAKLACEAVSRVIETEGNTFFKYPEKKAAYLLTEQILYWIEQHKGKEDLTEYGSTFLLVLMEKKDRRECSGQPRRRGSRF